MGSVFVDPINANENGHLSREPVKDHVIELIYSIIFWREDGVFKKELV